MTDEDRELAAAGARYSRSVATELEYRATIAENAITHDEIQAMQDRRRRSDALRNWRMERGLLWFAIGVGAFFAWFATFGSFWWLYWAAWQVYTYQRWRDERRARAHCLEHVGELPAARLLRP